MTATNAAGYSTTSTVTVPLSSAANFSFNSANVVVANQVQNTSNGVVTGQFVLNNNPANNIQVNYSKYSGMALSTGSITVNSDGTFVYTPTHVAMSNSNLLGPYTDTFQVQAVVVSTASQSNRTTITMPILAKCLLCW